ncbi:hypothetical protein GCM10027599_18370 [Yimella radicis]
MAYAQEVPSTTQAPHRSKPVPGGRREAAKSRKRAAILVAAQAQLAENGYDRMTVANVAQDGGVAIGTLFTYAATKAELLMMVTADRWSHFVPSTIQSAPPGDPVRALRHLLAPFVDIALREPATTVAVARELLFGQPGPHRQAVLSLVADLETAMARLLAEAGSTRAAEAATMLFAGVLFEANRARDRRIIRADDMDERVEHLIEACLPRNESSTHA